MITSVVVNTLQKPNPFYSNGFPKRSTGLSIATQIFGVLAFTIVSGALIPRSPTEKLSDTKKEEGLVAPQTMPKKD